MDAMEKSEQKPTATDEATKPALHCEDALNDLLAKQVGFKDDKKLKDDEQIPLAKTVGWLLSKELFGITRAAYQEFMKELIALGEKEPSEEQKAKIKHGFS